MARIEKKVKEKYFKDIIDGRKKFEVRLADFKCKPGDILILKEQKGDNLTSRKIECEVLYKLNTKDIEKFYSKKDAKKHGLVILSIRKEFRFK